MKVSPKIAKLHKEAVRARQLAYAPYSKFKVGAALLDTKGKVVRGCNVENASYGGTVCAERVAILRSVADGQHSFSDIMVVTDASKPAMPCALCLQTMAEFFEKDTRIWIASPRKVVSVHLFKELLPKPFGPKQLKAAK